MAQFMTIPPWTPFLKEICRRWFEQAHGDPKAMGRGVIILPGRRASKALAKNFGMMLNGRAALLPRIMSIGDVEDAELELLYPQDGSFWHMPDRISVMERLSALCALILKRDKEQPIFGAPLSLAQAWPLAQELANLMDEAEREDVDLVDALQTLCKELAADISQHWQDILQFLDIITRVWPIYLKQIGACNPVKGQTDILKRQLTVWQNQIKNEGDFPIWAVGFTHAPKTTQFLLKTIANFPSGKIIFPGVDIYLSQKTFSSLPDTHPQKGIANIMKMLKIGRDDLQFWESGEENPGIKDKKERWHLFSQIMVPTHAFTSWTKGDSLQSLKNISRFEASDPQQEARGISMIIRDALREKDRKIALVTPDRMLAELVRTSLERWGILADDSAGETLKDTVGGVLLRLIAALVRDDFTPASWLAVMKHPFVTCGYHRAQCRELTRLFEIKILRGTRPGSGFSAIKKSFDYYKTQLQKKKSQLQDAKKCEQLDEQSRQLDEFMMTTQNCLQPLRHLKGVMPVPEILRSLIQTAENLAPALPGHHMMPLWRGEDGRALAYCLVELLQESAIIPQQKPDILPGLLDAVLGQQKIPFLNHDAQQLHPRVFLWGRLEGRLQDVDTVILGGLNEGVWPEHRDSGPWLNRLMRNRIGLPTAEYQVGEDGYGFCSLCARAAHVVLSSSHRREDSVVVPSRWIQRIEAFMGAQGASLASHPANQWLNQLDRPRQVEPAMAPTPRPALNLRPRQLSVTEIETFIKDPYSIYAKHVLGLRPLDTLLDQAGGREFGNIAHDLVHWWWDLYKHENLAKKGDWDTQSLKEKMTCQARHLLAQERISDEIQNWWLPRLISIGEWMMAHVEKNDMSIYPEIRGKMRWDIGGHNYQLNARADFLAIDGEGQLSLCDYKTGTVPSQTKVKAGWNPQLPMEAVMASNGGFNVAIPANQIGSMYFIRIPGGSPPAAKCPIVAKKDEDNLTIQSQKIFEKFQHFWALFDQPQQAYTVYPRPQIRLTYNDYEQLSRYEEWQFSSPEKVERSSC